MCSGSGNIDGWMYLILFGHGYWNEKYSLWYNIRGD